MTPDQIREAIDYLDACLRNLTLDEEGAVRSMDDEAQADFDAGLALRTKYAADLERLAKVENLAPVSGVRGDSFTAPNVIVRDDVFDLSDLRYNATTGELRDRALRVTEKVDGLADHHREEMERVVRTLPSEVSKRVVVTSAPAYRTAFMKLVSGDAPLLTDDERNAVQAVRAASLTTTAGGFAVPAPVDTTIIDTGTHSVNPFRQISRIEKGVTNVWKGVSSAGVTASWDAEGAEVSDDAPTLAQPTVTAYKGQVFVPFSVEIEGDWAAIESDLRTMIAQSKDDLEGAAFATGTGSAQPFGITTALDGVAGSEIAPTTAETFAVADLYKVENALADRYLPRASWVANKAIYNLARQFDTAGGANLWVRLDAGRPGELIGYPAYSSSNMDAAIDPAATADNFIAVLGDFSNYVIYDRVGLSVELVPHLFHTSNNRPSGSRGFLAWFRTGADSVNDAAFAMLSIPTAA